MQIKKINGVLLTIAVGLTPVILWLLFSPATLVVTQTTQKLDALAKIAALSGLALLSFNIILSARLPVFERLFLGLDRAYRAHRIIGGSVLILLMLHAALITAKYSSISLLSGYEYLKPNLDVALMLGKIALGAMIVLVAISMYIKIKYQWFVTIQRCLGAMIFVGGYHALFVSNSDLRTNLPLFAYFLLIGGSAAGLYVYRSLFHKTVKRKLDYIVDSLSQTEGITVIWLKPLKNALACYAGQFAFFQFSSASVSTESHPFSISSGSDDSRIRIATKALGDYTSELHKLKTGDLVKVEGPYGYFSFTKIQNPKQVWVAGGIGITPFVAMAHSLPPGYQVTLYYRVRTMTQAIFLKELQGVACDKPGFEIVTICTNHGQSINAKELAKDTAAAYLMCASPAMMHRLNKQLRQYGIPKHNIYYEDFALT